MKQVININFQGRVVPIETTAFEILKNYTDSLNRHFASEVGKEEIINDIESRIGELFQQRLTKGATCITDDDVNAVINSIGRPEEFEPMDDNANNTSASSNNSTNQQQSATSGTFSTATKRLYRNENDKVLGGVCSGLANYFNIDVVIVRIIFVVLLFAGAGFLAYLIMWVAVPSTASTQIGGTRKKLFRDPDEKIVAGVCSGIGNYFGINPWIPRALFLLPFLSFISRWGHWGGLWDFGDVVRFTFSPTSLIIYIILWIVIPEALTTSEKLEMKGEKVDMNSIKNSVMEEMKTVGKKAEKFGASATELVNEKAKIVSDDVQNFARRNKGGLGNVIGMIIKIFAYFIIGCVCLAIFGGLIGVIVGSSKVYPLKDYLLAGDWQNAFAWGTLLFFIAVPVIAILVWLIRKITNSKSNSRILRLTFISLWVIGWVCVILLATNLTNEFRRKSRLTEEEITLSNPNLNKLIVNSTSSFERTGKRYRWQRFDSFDEFLDEDTIKIQNINLSVVASLDDRFHVRMLKESRGNTKENAASLANKIAFNVVQIDSLLVLDDGIEINKIDKFRNQTVFVTIEVPVGKQIKVKNDYFRRIYFNSFADIDDYDSEDNFYNENRWQSGVDYIMKADGLYTLDGRKADGYNDRKRRNEYNRMENRNNRTNDYRYNEYEYKADSLRMIEDLKKQRRLDSIQRVKEKLDSIESNIENSASEFSAPLPISAAIMPGFDLLTNIN